jgi:hypothetical protein
MRGFAEVVAFRGVAATKSHGISPGRDGHGLQRFLGFEHAAFARNDRSYILFQRQLNGFATRPYLHRGSAERQNQEADQEPLQRRPAR